MTEGRKTEPNYFTSFGITSLRVVGAGCNTTAVVVRAKEECAKQKFDEVWCVFDRDDHPLDQFNAAIEMARREGYKLAVSNEAFELWFVLHFEYLQAALHRTAYCEKLTTLLGFAYAKNCEDMYEKLESRMGDALRNAKRLETLHAPGDQCLCNPYTSVYALVERLNTIKRG